MNPAEFLPDTGQDTGKTAYNSSASTFLFLIRDFTARGDATFILNIGTVLVGSGHTVIVEGGSSGKMLDSFIASGMQARASDIVSQLMSNSSMNLFRIRKLRAWQWHPDFIFCFSLCWAAQLAQLAATRPVPARLVWFFYRLATPCQVQPSPRLIQKALQKVDHVVFATQRDRSAWSQTSLGGSHFTTFRPIVQALISVDSVALHLCIL